MRMLQAKSIMMMMIVMMIMIMCYNSITVETRHNISERKVLFKMCLTCCAIYYSYTSSTTTSTYLLVYLIYSAYQIVNLWYIYCCIYVFPTLKLTS